MKIIITLCSILLSECLFAQTKNTDVNTNAKLNWQFTINPIVGLHFNIYNKGFNQLNDLLNQNNVPPFAKVFSSIGSYVVMKAEGVRAFQEISFTESVLDRPLINRDWLVPKLKGINIGGGMTKKIWERKKLSLELGLGFRANRYTFRLIDRRNVQNPFDTLLKYPSQSFASLDFTQKSFSWNLEGRFGITYNTKWFPKGCDSYDFSLYINYSQAIFRSKDWYVSDTNAPVKGFPDVNFSNCYFLFVNSVFFKR